MASQAVINLVVDASNADNQINAQVRRIVNDAERQAPNININVVVNNNSVNNITNQMRRLGDQTDDTNRRTGGLGSAFGKLGSMAGTLGSVAGKMGAIGVAAGGAVPLVASVAGALAQIAPAAAAGATALTTVVAAGAVLKIGMQGVGDAIKSAFDPEVKPEDLAKQMEALAPEARKFVLALKDMSSGFKDLQLDIQNRLFKDFDASIKTLGREAMPTLKKAAFEMAEALNGMGRSAIDAAGEVSKDGTLGNALRSGTDAMETMEKVPGRIIKSIALIAEAGGPLFERFAEGVNSAVKRMTDALARGAETGRLTESVNAAGDALAQLGDIGGNVGRILSNVFSTVGESGASLFDALENITAALADATGTKAFTDALITLIGVFQTLSSVLMPLFSAALSAILPVITAIAGPIERLILLLGDQLLAIMPTVTDILTVLADIFANLILAVEPFIELILNLVSAILPLLVPLLEVISETLALLGPVFEEIAAQLAEAFIPVLESLMPLIEMLAEVFLNLVKLVLPLLVEIISGQLLPIIIRWFEVLAELLIALTPVIEAILQVATSILEFLIPAISGVLGFITGFADVLVTVLSAVIRNVVIPALNFLAKLLSGDFSGAWQMVKTLVGEVAGAVGRFIGNMVSTALSLLGKLVSGMINTAKEAFKGMVRATVNGAKNVVDQVKKLPGQAKRALGDLGKLLVESGKAIIRGLIRGIKSMVGAVKDAVGGVLKGARNLLPFSPAREGPFSGKGWTLFSGQALIDGLMEGIQERAPMLRAEMGKALGGLDSTISTQVSSLVSPVNLDAPGRESGLQSYYSLNAPVDPKIFVSIGNEAINKYVDVRIQNNDQRRDRLALQGVRR